MVEINVHAKGSTGNSSAVVQHADGLGDRILVEFEVEAVGGTPTITWQIEGSNDGSTWTAVSLLQADASVATTNAAIVATTVSKVWRYIDGLDKRWFSQLRVRTTLNTNVTYSSRFYTPAASFS